MSTLSPAPEEDDTVIVVTPEDIIAQLERIYKEHPRLRDYIPECGCKSEWCSGQDLTSTERRAYSGVRTARFLLGESI